MKIVNFSKSLNCFESLFLCFSNLINLIKSFDLGIIEGEYLLSLPSIQFQLSLQELDFLILKGTVEKYIVIELFSG